MRAAVAVIVLAACSGSPPRKRVKRPHGPESTTVIPAATTDELLDERWENLGLTADNWPERVATIPEHLREVMATRLLESQSFVCDSVAPPDDACMTSRALRLPDKDATMADPCLRRQLALWAIDQLHDEATILSLEDELTTLVMLPEPERELPAAAIAKMPTGFLKAAALWNAKAAGHDALVSAHVLDDLDHEDLRQAALGFHLDAAVLALDPVEDDDVYIEAIVDDALQTTTRIAALQRMLALADTYDDSRRLRLANAAWDAREGDCLLAAAASAALAELGEGKLELPRTAMWEDADVIRATCSLLGVDARGAPWRRVITMYDLAVVNVRSDPFRVDALWTQFPFAYDDDEDGAPDVPDADPDGDGDVATTRTKRVTYWTKRFTLPYADELRLALPHCDGTDCRVPGTSVRFHLDIAQEKGTSMRLQGIQRYERLGSDC